jgi:TPR repeat protein
LAAARYFKLAADQNDARAQNALSRLIWDGRRFACDLIATAHYFELTARQGIAQTQYRYGIWLLTGHQNSGNAIPTATK